MMHTGIEPRHRFAADVLAEAENQQSGITNPEPWLLEAFGGSRSSSGVRVSTDTVLGLPAAWRSVDLISSKLASMPVEVQKRIEGQLYEAMADHPVDRLLNRYCGQLYTCFTFRQMMTLHALLEGNGRAYILRDGLGNPVSLTPMMPKSTYTMVINGEKFHVVFFTRDMYGDVLTPEVEAAMRSYGNVPVPTGNGSFFTIPDSDVLHIPGLTYNGLWGLPLVSVARDIFGIDQAGHDAMGFQFQNGGRPSMLLEIPRGTLPTEKQLREFMQTFRANYSGTHNQGKVGALRDGITAQTVNAQNTFTGLQELTQASKDDIALLFGTEYVLGEAAAVYKDLQSRMSAFYSNTLDKWAETWEQEAGRKLLNRQSFVSGRIRVHLDPTAILRGTPDDLSNYTGQLRTQGLINGNEGRAMHNLPPVDGLDDDYGNPAITPGGEQEPEPQAEPQPTEEPEDTQAENRGQRAIARHFSRMQEFECRRILECVNSDGGFLTNVERFYDGFEEQLTDLCEDLLINPALAESHCQKSIDEILNVAGVAVGPEQLETEINKLTATWEKRYVTFTDAHA